jgi:glycosyltransferase involved in cell wall biosynthesis
MRIDLVITELYVGGAERCLTELALMLYRGGDRVRVASIAPLPTGQQARLVQRLSEAGIEVYSAGGARPWQAARAFASLRRWLAADRPDVVQTMLFHANVLGTWAARSAGVSACVGGMRVAEPKPHRLWLERQAVRRMDAVVCVSESVRQFAVAAFGTALPAVSVIGNAIDQAAVDAIPLADWSEFGWPADASVLLYVGRLHPQKGVDLLAAVVEPLLASQPEMRCLIVGEGPLRESLQQVAERVGPARMQLAGWRADALSLLKACRVVVLPSRYEGMPNVVLEAMACGKPVAVSRVEGVEELLGDLALTQTYPPADGAALRAVLERLWGDQQEAESLGQANRRRAAEIHDLRGMANRYRQLYQALVAPN